MHNKLVLNGRFLGRPMTGVDRLATELTKAIRGQLAKQGSPDLEVAIPSDVADSQVDGNILGSPAPVFRVQGRMRGQVWEQVVLPRIDRKAFLLSLCNIGPVFRKNQALIICDAQFILHPESYSRLFRWWYRLALPVLSRRARIVFTISEFSRDNLERYSLVPAGKAQILRLGIDHVHNLDVDPTILNRSGLTKDRYILAIGSLAPHKNLRMLVDAFVEAELDDITLVVAGGNNARVFRDAGLPQNKNTRYIGRVDDQELKALYQNALAFACPSLSEGFGFTPLEAMALNCPVVATSGGAVPEVCGDAVLYADPASKESWRSALVTMVGDSALRTTLRAKGLRQAADYSWDNAALQFLTAVHQEEGANEEAGRE